MSDANRGTGTQTMAATRWTPGPSGTTGFVWLSHAEIEKSPPV